MRRSGPAGSIARGDDRARPTPPLPPILRTPVIAMKPIGPMSRRRRSFLRSVLAAAGGAAALGAIGRPGRRRADGILRPPRRGRRRRPGRPARRRGRPDPDHPAGDDPRQAEVAVPQGPHRRRDRRPRRADRRGEGGDLRRRDQGAGGVPHRQGPEAGRPPLAGDVPPRLLSRRAGAHQRHQRRRHGPLGHQGQGPRRPRLRAARRADPDPNPRLRPRPDARDDPSPQGGGLHRLQDRSEQGPAAPDRRDPRLRPQGRRRVRRAARDRRRRRRHRHRLPRRRLAADGQAADQGPRAVSADVHRGARRLPARRRDGRDRPGHRTCRSPPASGSSPSGASERSWRRGPRRSSSRTSATPAGSPRSA